MKIVERIKKLLPQKDTRSDEELTEEELLKRQQKRMMKKRMKQTG